MEEYINSYQLNFNTLITRDLSELSWISPHQGFRNTNESHESDGNTLVDLVNIISPSAINDSEDLNDLSIAQLDCHLTNEDETLTDFISNINMHLNSSNNNIEATFQDFGSITCTMYQSCDTMDGDTNKTSDYINFKMSEDNNSRSIRKKKIKILEKVNKKQNNKEAAIRYRLKKVKEKFNLFATRDSFKNENEDLKKKIEDIQIEINFVKNILVEMLLKKV